MSRILRVEKRGPFKTSVSRKTACEDDSSCVNLIVGWKELTKLTKSLYFFCWYIPQTENVIMINESFPDKRFERTRF